METASFSETSPRKYKSGEILVGEECSPIYRTWAVCEFVYTAVVYSCGKYDIPPASLEMRAETCAKCPLVFCAEVYREMSAQSPGPDINCRVIYLLLGSHVRQTAHLKGPGVTTSCCICAHNWEMLRIFQSASLTAPMAVLCTLQDSCSVRSAYFQSPSAIFTISSLQIPARVPAVLTGFSGFIRYLQTDAGIIPYLKLGHDHCLSHLF
jgi:hypothetical protein